MLTFLVLAPVWAFLGWIVYDMGVDTGYERCWHEHHPKKD